MFNYDPKQNKIYMPNEIFEDLKVLHDKGSSHVAFAYSFYYLISWLYRYAKYGQMVIDVGMIKKALGYSATYQEVNYIIKKNGVLDQLGYTESSTNFPDHWEFDGEVIFVLLQDLEKDTIKRIQEQRGKNYKIKVPLKGLHRTKESEIDHYNDGTFYEVSNTHLVPFDVFMFCMSKKDIGCIGFYLWSYLKMKHQQFKNGYDVSLNELSQETSIAKRTLIKYLNTLRGHRMINCRYNQEYFSLGLDADERKANTYTVNDEGFSNKPIEFNKLKMKKDTCTSEIDELFL